VQFLLKNQTDLRFSTFPDCAPVPLSTSMFCAQSVDVPAVSVESASSKIVVHTPLTLTLNSHVAEVEDQTQMMGDEVIETHSVELQSHSPDGDTENSVNNITVEMERLRNGEFIDY